MLSTLNRLVLTAVLILFGSSEVFAQSYCTARADISSDEYIKSVMVNGVTNTTGGTNYSLTEVPKFRLVAGVANPIALTPGFRLSSKLENWAIWIDLNRDGIFSGSEQLYSGSSKSVISTGISFPGTVPYGDARMRVVLRWSTTPTACGVYTYGEVEDYTVTIASNTPPNQILTFENLFGPLAPGATNQYPGPTIVVDGITISTTWPYFYQKSGAPFTSQYFRVVQPTFQFPAKVYSLNFQASGNFQGTATYLVIADGVTIGSFPLNFGVLSPLNIPIPGGARTVRFYDPKGASFNMDNFAINYQPPAFSADQILNFENLFGPISSTGTNQAPGPTIVVDGITITTTWPFFYQKVGAPFSSEYFRVVQPTFSFPRRVRALTFQASGNYQGVATYQVIADGVTIQTFDLSYGVLTQITIPISNPASVIRFYDPRGASFNMDNFSIDYQ